MTFIKKTLIIGGVVMVGLVVVNGVTFLAGKAFMKSVMKDADKYC